MKHYRQDLQILRGFAVILVLFYHLKIIGFENGYLGVDLFFVLSGYLMVEISEKATVLDFYKRRLARLIPAYFVTILITTLAVLIFTVPSDSNQHLDRLWFDFLGMSNIAFWLENSYFNDTTFKPLLNLWSLGVEIQFYLIAPFILPFLRKRVFFSTSILILSLIFSLIILTISPKTSFFMMPTRLWEFLIGAFVAWYPLINISNFKKKIFSYISLIVLVAVVFLYPFKDDSTSVFFGHPGLASISIVLATGLLISLNLKFIINFESLISKIFIKLGDYSYSIYLTHFPIIVLINYYTFGGTNLGVENLTDLIIILLGTAIMSYFMFNFVEVLRFKKSFMPLISIIILLLVLIGSLGSYLVNLKFSDKQNLIFDSFNDRATYRCGKLFRILNPAETICRIGSNDNKQKILLLGNSHADTIKVSFSNIMDNKGLSTFFYVANNPLMSLKDSAVKITSDIKRFNIKKIIVHNNPSFYEKNFNIKQLKMFLNLMVDLDVDVSFIAPIPVYKVHIPKILYSNTINPSLILPKQTIDDYLNENIKFFEFIKETNISKKRLYFPHIYLCKDENCIIQDKRRPIYFDSNHLTLTGANLLTPLFEKIADKANK